LAKHASLEIGDRRLGQVDLRLVTAFQISQELAFLACRRILLRFRLEHIWLLFDGNRAARHSAWFLQADVFVAQQGHEALAVDRITRELIEVLGVRLLDAPASIVLLELLGGRVQGFAAGELDRDGGVHFALARRIGRDRKERDREEREKREKWLCFVYRDWHRGFKRKIEMTRESAALFSEWRAEALKEKRAMPFYFPDDDQRSVRESRKAGLDISFVFLMG